MVNNVETLAYLPHSRNGPEWFARTGPESSPGYKSCRSRSRAQAGELRMPLGVTIRQLIEIARADRARAARSSACSRAAVRRRACSRSTSTSYDFDTIAKAGSMIGSGAMVVFDDTTDFVKASHALIRFLRARIVRPMHALPRRRQLARDNAGPPDRRARPRFGHRRDEVGLSEITGFNLCPLGDSIEPFFGSVLNRFEDQFRAYVRNARPLGERVA